VNEKQYYAPERLRIYIASPISQVTADLAVENAVDAAQKLVDDGRFAPWVPALTVAWEHLWPGKNDHDTWLAIDLPWVLVADAVLRLPGPSRGADTEVGFAQANGIPVYDSVQDLIDNPPVRGDARFHAHLKRLGTLHDKKQRDYGSDADPFANVRGAREWGIEPWVSALVRATDKIKRLQKFARRGSLENESALDSFDDLAVYAVIARILFEEDAKLTYDL
jgi:nucleoside 2-deoxyribosyltransferase